MNLKINMCKMAKNAVLNTKTLFIAAGLISCSAIFAQSSDDDDPRYKVAFGPKAGVNISNVWDSSGEEFVADAKVGFTGGVFVGIPIGKFFGVQPELLISQKGFKGEGRLLGTDYSFKRTTTYLDIPLLAQFKPAKFITIVAGPQYSFLFKEKNDFTFGSNSVQQEEQFDNDNIRRNTFGLVGGLDVIVKQFVISGRVAWDLTSNHGDGSSSTPRYRNRWVQVALGYNFIK